VDLLPAHLLPHAADVLPFVTCYGLPVTALPAGRFTTLIYLYGFAVGHRVAGLVLIVCRYCRDARVPELPTDTVPTRSLDLRHLPCHLPLTPAPVRGCSDVFTFVTARDVRYYAAFV